MRLPLASFAAVIVIAVSGCADQHDCTTACLKLFGDKEKQCNIQVPGHTGDQGRQDMINTCEDHCEQAMGQAGELGDYNPNERSSGNEDVAIENDAQAAVWMDCISETACDDLNSNYCAPTTNFP